MRRWVYDSPDKGTRCQTVEFERILGNRMGVVLLVFCNKPPKTLTVGPRECLEWSLVCRHSSSRARSCPSVYDYVFFGALFLSSLSTIHCWTLGPFDKPKIARA